MEQISNTNQSNLIGQMHYKITGQDYKTALQNYYKIAFNNAGQSYFKVIIFLIIPLLCLIMLTVLSKPEDSVLISYIIGICMAIFLLIFLIPIICKISIANKIGKSHVYSELNTVTAIYFYEDRIEQVNFQSHCIFIFTEIRKICEFADGLYIAYQNGKFTYIPARFFNKEFVFQITSFLQQRLGAKYRRISYMNVSDTAEYSEESENPSVEEVEPRYEFNFIMQSDDVAAMARGGGLLRLIIITVIFAVISAVCFSYCMLGENPSNLLFLPGLLSAVVAVFLLLIIFKSFSLNKFAAKNMHMKYFDDHLTAITEKSVVKVDYTRIKSVKRFKNFVRILLNNNTFFYVPESSAQSAEQFEEFEQFIEGFVQKKKS